MPTRRDLTPCRPEGYPFWYFLRNPFLVTDPLRESVRQKKRDFFVKIFQKVPKNGFFDLFFQKFACSAENLTKTASFSALGESRV